jgi:hypothetical protein
MFEASSKHLVRQLISPKRKLKYNGVVVIGQTEEVREQFYTIAVERKISHPAVAAITETARVWLFRVVSWRPEIIKDVQKNSRMYR